jgi:hypothetical protein
MILSFRPACLAVATLVIAGPAAAQTWVYEPDAARYYARAYTPVVVEQPVAQTQRTVVSRTVIPQGRGRAPIVKERIVTETTSPIAPRVVTRAVADDYAYAGVVRREIVARPVVREVVARPVVTEVVARPVVREVVARPVIDAYAYAPAPRARVVTTRTTTTTVVDDYAYAPRAYVPRVVESYGYQPVVNRVWVVDPNTGD